MRPTRVEIDLSAIKHNVKQIRSCLRPINELMAVVKANAYGHGAVEVSKAALAAGADALAVAIPEEGITLREQGITAPILVLGVTLPQQALHYAYYKLTATVCSAEHIKNFALVAQQTGIPINVMVKIDTGMSRIGIPPENTLSFITSIVSTPGIILSGIFTHLATADSHDKSFANLQLSRFNTVIEQLKKNNIKLPVISAANSAAILDIPTDYTIARAGIALYGLQPSNEMVTKLDLKPVMQLKSKILFIKEVEKDTPVSYGCTYQTSCRTKLATIPIGYADGYSRHLSNKAPVLIGGKRYPLVGRVCMDQIIVDLGPDSTAKVGDEVVLFGRQGNDEITATELADIMETINYEIICNISLRVPRIYLND